MLLALTAQRLLWALWGVRAAGKAVCAVGCVCALKAVCALRVVSAVCGGRVFADPRAVCSVGCASAVCCVCTVGGCVLRAVCREPWGCVPCALGACSPQHTQPLQTTAHTGPPNHSVHSSLTQGPHYAHSQIDTPEAFMKASPLHEGSLKASPVHEGFLTPS